MQPNRPADRQCPNFLTVDVEEYFHVNYAGVDAGTLRQAKTHVEAQVDRLLKMFDEARIHCTFFTLGETGEKYPSMVRAIHRAGHEVASHGYTHDPVHQMTAVQFREQLGRSCGFLRDLTGAPVLGYRAPSFSVTAETLPWFYETLAQSGLRYSSSVFPGRTFLYGIPGYRQDPHCSSFAPGVMEFPITLFRIFHRRYPLYVRLLPAGALERRLRAANRDGRPGILYVHPREIDLADPKLPLSRLQSFIHYWGVRGCEAKLRRVATSGLNFIPMREYVEAFFSR